MPGNCYHKVDGVVNWNQIDDTTCITLEEPEETFCPTRNKTFRGDKTTHNDL